MRRFLSLFTMLMLCGVLAFAQNRVVSGKVVDDKGNSVPFASVTVKGTKSGVSADANGEFSITIPKNATPALIVSTSSGLGSKEIALGNQQYVVITINSGVKAMEEVIITAGGIKTQKKTIGTASTQIKAEALTAGKAANIAAGLQGKVAGLQISGTGSGVNPSYRLILRGQRSLTGNNQALVVLDNVIVPNEVLGNLNPEDIEDVVVLNGGGAAALYGSQASNGALIVTTKKGKSGRTTINVGRTATFEQVAFFPKLQTSFGSGGSAYGIDANGQPVYNDQSNVENQSYGPRFDNTMRSIGYALEDGSQDSALYAYKSGHNQFWVTGLTNQTDLSLSTGDANSTIYVAGQYVTVDGTTPNDKYNRTTLRVNGTRKFAQKINATYSIGYTQNRYNTTSATGSVYGNMLNMPSNIDITKYKNWQTDKFANPNGYYNPWYQNPYFTIDNNRSYTRNDYLVGSVELKYSPVQGLDFVGRQGISTRNNSNKGTSGGFKYTAYAKAISGNSKSDIAASVSDASYFSTQLITDLYAQYQKRVKDFNFNVILGGQWKQTQSKSMNIDGSGLVVPDLYNIANSVGTPTVSEANYLQRDNGIYVDGKITYKGFLTLHATGRNDQTSVLEKENRSFFYPSFDGALVITDAIPSLKDNKTLSFLKLRAGWSKVGLVNIGAYSLLPTFSSNSFGFPYGSLAGYAVDNGLVAKGLKPEITKGYEAGFDLNLFDNKFTSSVTYFSTKTSNQVITTNVSRATGYSSLLTNVGVTSSKGVEVTAHVTPVSTKNLNVTVGGNFSYLDNNVESIAADIAKLSLNTSGSGASYAIAGQAFPVIMGFDYKRDPDGHVIVDGVTGLPTKSDTISILGNAQPKIKLGLDGAVNFKGFTLSVLFEYRGDYQIFQGIGTELDWSGTGWRTAQFDRQRFVFPNSVIYDGSKYVKNTNVTIKNGNGNNGFWSDGINRDVTSNYVTSGDFWKLRELSLSYAFPAKLFTTSKFLKGCSFSIQGRNLFLWMAKDNYYSDPEYSAGGSDNNGIGLSSISQTPPSRYYGASLKLTF